MTMIKEYSRPAAGKADAVASDLRPPEVLLETMHYMITKYVGRKEAFGPNNEILKLS